MRVKFLIIIALLFIACENVENDTDVNCTTNCTRIQGRIYTSDNLPLKNVQIVFEHISYDGQVTNYRKIEKVKTDSQGNYVMDVFIEADELGDTSGRFELYVKASTLRSDLLYKDFNLEYPIDQIQNRDTVITRNVFFAKKKNVKIRLENFIPVTAGDQFQVQVVFPTGFDRDQLNSSGNYHGYQNSGINSYMASDATNEFSIPVANGELNYINIVRTKNGVYSEESYPIVFNATAPATLSYQF